MTACFKLLAVAAIAILAMGCDNARSIDEPSLGSGACTACHGTGENPAPPRGLRPQTAANEAAVGAHQAHLQGLSNIAAPVACGECHRVPRTVSDPGHIDDPEGAGRAEVIFGPRATLNGRLSPSYDPATRTCAGTACHTAAHLDLDGDGALPALEDEDLGGRATAPAWDDPDPISGSCDACHGAPPPAPHPASTECSACHAAVVALDGTIVAPELHMDGRITVDLSEASCSSCHGSAENPAPPRSLDGATEVSDASVGLHQLHLKGDRYSQGVPCSSCHRVPARVDQAGHLDAAPADLTFSGLATAGGALPVWDRASGTCTGSYCHGAASLDPAVPEPAWTGSPGFSCDACHATPPPTASHRGLTPGLLTVCAGCHAPTVLGDGTINREAGTHINGRIDVF